MPVNRSLEAGATASHATLRDGNTGNWVDIGSGEAFGWVDLGAEYVISRFHLYYLSGRTYFNARIYGSKDNVNWIMLNKKVDVPTNLEVVIEPWSLRYFRVYTTGNNVNAGNHPAEFQAWDDGDTEVVRPTWKVHWQQTSNTTGTTGVRCEVDVYMTVNMSSTLSHTGGVWVDQERNISGEIALALAEANDVFPMKFWWFGGTRICWVRNIWLEGPEGRQVYDIEGYRQALWDSVAWMTDNAGNALKYDLATSTLVTTGVDWAEFVYSIAPGPTVAGGQNPAVRESVVVG
jgi:hypothetical protein